MSRERDRYELSCRACGATGEIVTWSDDWNRWGVERQTGFSGCVRVTGPQAAEMTCEGCGSRQPDVRREP